MLSSTRPRANNFLSLVFYVSSVRARPDGEAKQSTSTLTNAARLGRRETAT
jgi:hypothetical protein